MNIQELESVCAVDQYGNYSEAAFYSASSLSVISKHVSKVEEELGVKLFERASKTRKVERTEAGRAIMPLLHEMLSAYNSASDVARSINKRGSRIRIGYSPRVGDFREPEIISRFMTKYSDIQVFRVIESRSNLIRMLENDVLDVLLLPLMCKRGEDPVSKSGIDKIPGIKWEHITTNCRLTLGLPVTHQFAGRARITKDLFPKLKDEVFLFSSREVDSVGTGQRSNLSSLFGIPPEDFKVRLVDFAEPTLAVKVVGRTGCLLPQLSFVPHRMGDVVFVPVDGWNHQVSLFLVYKENHLKAALRKFCGVVDEFIEELTNKNEQVIE